MTKNTKFKKKINFDPGELVDKLSILHIKEIKLSKSKTNFSKGISNILKDLNKYFKKKLNVKLINYIIILSQINLYIWDLRDEINKEKKIDKKKLKLSHQLNAIRNIAKNKISNVLLDQKNKNFTIRTNIDLEDLKNWNFSVLDE
jgi:hypothetical protein|tara:strand:+ start:753 stop:1187 length:435 start_codon:yes stop_codon:yes gene_type:complete